ncbi:unnamed protein product [Durusdinium trenchii]|uniref:Uncharacterized protein n=2 Tax=Durusdinium trenchii TaxID=1381693 RepID=A0ABP0QXX0_9DINO
MRYGTWELFDRGMLLAALAAGVELQGLQSLIRLDHFEEVPFRVAVALSGTPWADFADLLPPPQIPWVPPPRLGEFILKVDIRSRTLHLCKDLLENVQRAGISLAGFKVQVHCRGRSDVLSLLDIAILFGQSDCAALLARAGAEVSDYGRELLRASGALDPGCRPAARAAAHAALSKLWKSEIAAKGIAIFQAMKKLSQGRSFPACLVDEVMALSLNVPRIINDLDLSDEAKAWCKSVCLHLALQADPHEEEA